MTIFEAKKFARKKTLKGTGIILAILILLLLFGETRGDFANGVLFFVDFLLNIHSIVLIIILFGLTYICAGNAGKEIIIEKQNVLIVSLKYVIMIALTISAYAVFAGFLREKDFTINGVQKVASEYFFAHVHKGWHFIANSMVLGNK